MLNRLTLTLALCATTASAQTSWIVDANNGPGAQFTDIQPAIDTASPGDIIAIRAGSYSQFAVSKPLAIQGAAGAVVDQVGFGSSPVTVSGIDDGEYLSIFGLAVVPAPLAFLPGVDVRDNAGHVLLEQVSVSASRTDISRSEAWLSDCTLTGLSATDATVVIADSSSVAGVFLHAVQVTRSRLTASRCSFAGTDANVTGIPGAGIRSTDSMLIVTDDGSNQISAGAGGLFITPAISGTGTLVVDPAVVLQVFGMPLISPEIAVTTRRVPSVRATGGDLGGTIDIDIFSPAQGSYTLLIGIPVTPTPLPPFGGELALGILVLPVQSGVQNGTEHTLVSLAVPANPALVGGFVAWQALAGDAAMTSADLSTPDFSVIRP